MPSQADLITIYLVVLVGFVVAALAYDFWRRRAARQPPPPQVNPLPPGRLGRIIGPARANGPLPPASGPVAAATPAPSISAPAEPAPAAQSAPAAAAAPSAAASSAADAAAPRSTPSHWWTELVERRNAERKAEAEGARSPSPEAASAGWSLPGILSAPGRIIRDLSRAAPSVLDQRLGGSERRRGRFAEDSEFLPAALEILETPPSPVATALMLGICGMCVAGLLWAVLGHLDIHAVAQGKIQASGRTKVVQPLEPGRVAAIHVESGQIVKEGDVLVELDPTETAADLEGLSREHESVAAETLRRREAVKASARPAFAIEPVAYPPGTSDRVRLREDAVLFAEVSQLRSAIEGFRAQIAERQATKKRLGSSIDARSRALGLSKERVGMRDEIRTRGAGSRALVIDAELQYENIAITDASERGQLAEADAGIKSLEARMVQAHDQFVAEQVQKASEAERRRDRLEQEIIKARSKRDRTKLRAPSGGTVQQIEVSTIGQVVASGQSLMSVVPVDAPLEVEAMIVNRDIGFVRPGQRAVVKVEAFPFTRYGTIEAEVVKVSADAVEDRNATAMMDAASAARPQANTAPRPNPGQNLVFPAVLKLDRRTMRIDGKEIPLTPGMAATIEIKTGSRRAISYILSPLSEVISTSGRER